MVNSMRIILYTGKGGVGKTTVAAATAVHCAGLGYKTIVLSTDPADSLSDSFDLGKGIVYPGRGQILKIAQRLDMLEVDVTHEITEKFGVIRDYLIQLFTSQGADNMVAEEIVLFSGMDELCALFYLNLFKETGQYEVVLVDCAPTGETLKFLSLPNVLEWYMKTIFKIQRTGAKLIRPFWKKTVNKKLPIPPDEVYGTWEGFYRRLDGINALLTDPKTTSARIVLNLEKMVLKESQRAYMYFCLYGICTDMVVVNRLIPEEVTDPYFNNWKKIQSKYDEQVKQAFGALPIFKVPLFDDEVVGLDRLKRFSRALYDKEDPTRVFHVQNPIQFTNQGKRLVVKVKLPFITKEEIDIYQLEDEVIINIGNQKRAIMLPSSLKRREIISAKQDGEFILIEFRGGD